MKILFVRPNKIGNRSIPVGITILQAILKQNGHSVRIFDTTFMTSGVIESTKTIEHFGSFRPVDMSRYTDVRECDVNLELLKSISEFKPDIIGFSVMSNDFEYAKNLAAVIKKRFNDTPLLFGGVHPTVDPENTIKCNNIDMICVGEGEEALVELLGKMERNENLTSIANIWIKNGNTIHRNDVRPFVDLDNLPPPDYSGFSRMHLYRPFWGRIYSILDIETSRGCYYACSECINAQLKKTYAGKGKYHREKSIEKAISDLKYQKEKYGIEMFRFLDENMFALNAQRSKRFFDLYKKEIALPFTCLGRVEYMTDDMVKIFKDAGCISVSIGIETGNSGQRAKILNRHMTNEQIIRAFDICNKYKLRTTGYHMLALPEERRSYIFESIKLIRRCKPSSIVTSFVYPFHGTPLRKYCLSKGYIKDNDPIVGYLEDTIIKNKYLSKARLKGLYRTFTLYTLVPRIMFPLIRICEYDNPISKNLRTKLIRIYTKKLSKKHDGFYHDIPNITESTSVLNPLLGELK